MNTFGTKSRCFLVTVLLLTALASVASAASPKLMAAFLVKGKVGLKWGKVAGVSEYLVFRKGPDGDFTQIGTTDQDRYFDETIVGGNTYVYKIAIVEDGQEVFSGTKSVTIPGATGAFTAPKWVGVRLDQDKVYLNWDPVEGAIAFNIWRSQTSGSDFDVVGTSQGSRYVDKEGLIKGTTYYYVLSAMNQEFEETPMSEERSIKYGISLEEQEALMKEENQIILVPFPLTQA